MAMHPDSDALTAVIAPPSPRSIHEAGHAVAAVLLGYTVRHVRVSSDPPECAIRMPSGMSVAQAPQPFLQFLMAGRTAEAIFHRECSGKSGFLDRSREIEVLRANFPPDEREAIRRSLEAEIGEMLRTRPCRRAVETLAEMLDRSGVLDGEVVASTVAKSLHPGELAVAMDRLHPDHLLDQTVIEEPRRGAV
jgi:hypothetical protein